MTYTSIFKLILLVVFLMMPIHANKNITQLDVITPAGLMVYDSLNKVSTTVKYPGLYIDSSRFKAITGCIDNGENSNDYVGYPSTQYDNQVTMFTNMVPYLSAQMSFPSFISGIYLGDFSVSSKTHNALSAVDSIKTFEKYGVKLNGAVWYVPKINYLKGISFWAEGVHQNRDTHFANVDGWKRIHTNYEYKRNYASGLLSSTFSFFKNQFSFLRFGYGKDKISAEEQRLDTLFFSNESYLTSAENIDKSFENYTVNMEIGHMLKLNGWNLGVFIGGDRTNFSYKKSEMDSSQFYVNTFMYKGFNLKKLVLYTGLRVAYSGNLFNKSRYGLGYLDLAKEYTVDRMSHYIDVHVPLFGVVKIGDKFTLMSGIDLLYNMKKSNYNFTAGTENISGFSLIDCILYPLNIQYAPTPKTLMSISPKFNKDNFIGSFEFRYEY